MLKSLWSTLIWRIRCILQWSKDGSSRTFKKGATPKKSRGQSSLSHRSPHRMWLNPPFSDTPTDRLVRGLKSLSDARTDRCGWDDRVADGLIPFASYCICCSYHVCMELLQYSCISSWLLTVLLFSIDYELLASSNHHAISFAILVVLKKELYLYHPDSGRFWQKKCNRHSITLTNPLACP